MLLREQETWALFNVGARVGERQESGFCWLVSQRSRKPASAKRGCCKGTSPFCRGFHLLSGMEALQNDDYAPCLR